MENLSNKTLGSTLASGEWNQPAKEIENIIEDTGQTLSAGDLAQLGKALAEYVATASFYTESGVADAYVLSPSGALQSVTSYTNGMRVEFVAGNDSTGAATINVNGLGVKDITNSSGVPGLVKAGIVSTFRYIQGTDEFLIQSASGPASNIVLIEVSGTYNPPIGIRSLKFTATGGGGGGGGAGDTGIGSPKSTFSTAGSGGGTVIESTNTIDAGYTIVIGPGGSGGVAGPNNGANGVATTVTSSNVGMTANGGLLGLGTTTNMGFATNVKSVGASASSSTSSDAIIIFGGDSMSSKVDGGVRSGTTQPGSSYWGGGSFSNDVPGPSVPGEDARNYGAGGGAGFITATTADVSGGDGQDGVVVVEEFF